MTRIFRLLAAVVVAIGTICATAPADATPPGWTESSAQWVSNQNFILNSVDVPASSDVWAVGYRYEFVGGALEFRTVVEHSTGGSFVMVPSPDRETAPATNFLQDVSGNSSTEVWAVGWSRPPGGVGRTLIEHWNGSSWSIATSTDPGQFGNILQGVVALGSNDVWAVGARQDSFYQAPMAEHWNGSSWSTATVPNPKFCTGHSYLTDINAVSPTNVWAVGWCTASSHGGEQGYVVRWNGSRWVFASAVTAGIPQNTELYGISVAGTRGIWAVGLSRDDGALALRWDGTAWQRLPIGPSQSQSTLAGVVAPYKSLAWTAGAGASPQPPFAGPAVVRFAGGTATPQDIPVDFGSLRGIAYDPAGRVWAVGTQLPGQYNTPLIVSRPA
jgi:hypothetical protein